MPQSIERRIARRRMILEAIGRGFAQLARFEIAALIHCPTCGRAMTSAADMPQHRHHGDQSRG